LVKIVILAETTLFVVILLQQNLISVALGSSFKALRVPKQVITLTAIFITSDCQMGTFERAAHYIRRKVRKAAALQLGMHLMYSQPTTPH
jgi:hypothetical protein